MSSGLHLLILHAPLPTGTSVSPALAKEFGFLERTLANGTAISLPTPPGPKARSHQSDDWEGHFQYLKGCSGYFLMSTQ